MDTTFTGKKPETLTATGPQNSNPRAAILLAGQDTTTLRTVHDVLLAEGFDVLYAKTFSEAEQLWLQLRPRVVLLDVEHQNAVPQALQTAIRIKQEDPRQFLAYLADPILRTKGLAGDAILSRDARRLPAALLRSIAGEHP